MKKYNINYNIRENLASVMSGSLIPFALFPWGIGQVLSWLPFGSIASAPLSIYTGLTEDVGKLLLIQLFWNVVIWYLAVVSYRKSEEEMISYGG